MHILKYSSQKGHALPIIKRKITYKQIILHLFQIFNAHRSELKSAISFACRPAIKLSTVVG